MIVLKTEQEIGYMRDAGRIVGQTLAVIKKAISPGITTQELDHIAEQFIRRAGGVPAFKGYCGFPASICSSINEQVVHGIPGPRQLKDGDVISIDIGVKLNRYYGDAAITVPVGEVDAEILKLLSVTEQALNKGIEQAIKGNRLSDISHAVQLHAEAYGYGVVRDYVGHGIGQRMHEDPQIPNYGPPGRGPLLKSGMTLAIEPMINYGTPDVEVLADDWTVVTVDRKISAHFEHTVAITEGEPEILTLP
ncbi:MAG: type I methionyl aminopeptidase [Negativicutes bacterium]|jgi:methionyl aminopeptidase|nr:type I methionyl aminopeptidase [Negativicutes bacterium]